MSSPRNPSLQDIVRISEQMLRMAREGQWQRVVELEAERRRLVESCFQLPTSEQDAPQVASTIREILRLNREVAELGQKWRSQLSSEIHTRKVGRAACAAYLNHAR